MHSILTVVDQLYFQQENGQPIDVPIRFSKLMRTDEQPYIRRIKVDVRRDVDTGWVERVAMVCIVNEEGRGMQRRPTSEEQADIDGRIVDVWVGGSPVLYIPPGEGVKLRPIGELSMRCRNGTARCTVTVIPDA
jgi:hypothetical protein